MRRILVLDDDQVILDLLQTVLTDAGYDAVLAPGLDTIPANTGADIVITDLLPLKAYRRETAVDWVTSLRSRFADSPVVIVTAHSSIDYDDLVERAQIVVDLRNATGRNGTGNGKVWKL